MTREFWKAALIRALRTVAQTAIATIGTTAFIQDVNWMMVGSASLLAGILSILTSIVTGLPEASFVPDPVKEEPEEERPKEAKTEEPDREPGKEAAEEAEAYTGRH